MTLAPSDILLTDRVAVVTGGPTGIGRGIADGLTRFGATVAIWEGSADTCAATADELGVSQEKGVRSGWVARKSLARWMIRAAYAASARPSCIGSY